MKKLSKLVLREYISPEDLVSKKAQKYILGGLLVGYGGAKCACQGDNGKFCCISQQHCDSLCGNMTAYCCSDTGEGCALITEVCT